jgi:hypothetical protein
MGITTLSHKTRTGKKYTGEHSGLHKALVAYGVGKSGLRGNKSFSSF